MLDVFRKLRDLLDDRERRRAALLVVMVLVMGVVESTRVASVFPFVAVLAQPEVVTSNRYLAAVYNFMGFHSTNQFLIFLGLGLFGAVVFSLAFSALTTWATSRFTAMRSYALSRRLFAGYLDQPYEHFLSRHSADLGNVVLNEVSVAISGALIPATQLVVQGAIAIALFGLLVIVDPLLAVIVTACLGGLYFLVFWTTRRYLAVIGEQRRQANRERYRISGEAFGGIKDVKILGLERAFLRRFEKPSWRAARYQTSSDLISQLPQYGMQAIAFAAVLIIVFYLLSTRDSLSQALPVIALYAVAGSRLMPALNGIYQSASRISYAKPGLDALHKDLASRPLALAAIDQRKREPAPLGLHDRLEIRGMSFRYPSAPGMALHEINLSVPARGAVGIVGKTGAGKTTLVDIILGLLNPASGELVVDGCPVTSVNIRAWQRTVGYVPQQIFLADDTVAANIAFGVDRDDIDPAAVERAARIANLHDFVVTELDQGYATEIGEHGIRLSGGQRQRVGIARALYWDPDLLIMDEGTSALDNVTERAVMEAVNTLARQKTIILIAHRLTTVRRCDTIIVLERGRVTASGPYSQLAEHDELFRQMVESATV